MSNKFRSVDRTDCLITPNLDTIIPKECPEIVTLLDFVESIPLTKFHVKKTEVGAPQYEPRMMLAVIIFAFMIRIFSSRVIADSLRYDDRFKYLAGRNFARHVTICRFIQNNGRAISECMTAFLLLAMEKNLLTGKNVGMDGTKLKANASLSETMTVEEIHEKLAEIEGDLEACQHLMAEQAVKEALAEAPLVECSEDEPDNQLLMVMKELEQLVRLKSKYMQALPPAEAEKSDASDVQVNEDDDDTPFEQISISMDLAPDSAMSTDATAAPNDLTNQLTKLTHQQHKLKRALVKADVDQADQAEYQFRKQHREEHLTKRRALQRDGAKNKSSKSAVPQTSVPTVQPDVLPEPDQAAIESVRANAKATPNQKVNLTDLDSRIMRLPGGSHIQGVNVQAITDLDSGFIMSVNVVSDQNDAQVMMRNIMMQDDRLNRPINLVADKGYANQDEIERAELLGINVITPLPNRRKNTELSEFEKWMKAKLAQPESKKLMSRRSFVVEGAFAQFKENLNFRKIYRRGLEAVNKEIKLLAIAQNFKRFHKLIHT